MALNDRRVRPLVSALFFLSGVTALILEVSWAKYFALLLGSTAHAHVLVLSVFMGGLSLGNHLFGRMTDRVLRPVALYGGLELLVAGMAWVYPLYFDGLSTLYLQTAASLAPGETLLSFLKASFCALSFLPSTVAMGGTFPLLARFMSRSPGDVSRTVGALYFLNTLGAAAGAWIAGFVLIPRLGLDGSVTAAAAILTVVGAVALCMGWVKMGGRPLPASGAILQGRGSGRDPSLSWQASVAAMAGLAALSGAVNMLYEVTWTRALTLFFGSSTYSFSIMLCTFLAGLALGGALYAFVVSRWRDPLAVFGAAQLGVGVFIAASLPLYERLPFLYAKATTWLAGLGSPFMAYQAVTFSLGAAVMIVPAILMGITLPAVTAATTGVVGAVGASVGAIFAFNTLGTIVGTGTSGLLLVPWAGLRGTFLIGTAVSILLGAAALSPSRGARPWAFWGLCVGGCAVFCAVWLLGGPWDPRLLARGEFRGPTTVPGQSFREYREALQEEVLFHRDGVNSTVTVLRSDDSIYLKVNGKTDASTRGDLATQLLLGHLPALLNPGARSAAVIGFGSGITAGALTLHPLDHIDIFEIAPEVVEAAGIFAPFNGDVTAHPAVRVHVRDAREAFLVWPRSYDIIVSEPSNPWMAGVSALFTREFFQATHRSLANRGILMQWFHNYAMTDELFLMVLKTVRSVFPLATVWTAGQSDILIAAFKDPDYAPDFSAMEERLGREGIDQDLRSIAIGDLYALLALQVLSPGRVDELIQDVESVNTDRMPILEYAAPRAFFADRSSNLLELVDEKALSFHEGALYLCPYVTQRPPDPRALEGIVEHERREGSYSQAFLGSVLEAWALMAPTDERPLLELARRYQTAGDLGGAEEKWTALLALRPQAMAYLDGLLDVWDAQAARTTSSLLVADSKPRRGLLQRMLALGGERSSVWRRLARLDAESGDWWGAVDKYHLAGIWLRQEGSPDPAVLVGIAADLDVCFGKGVQSLRAAIINSRKAAAIQGASIGSAETNCRR